MEEQIQNLPQARVIRLAEEVEYEAPDPESLRPHNAPCP